MIECVLILTFGLFDICGGWTTSEIYGEEMLSSEDYFVSGPYGSMNGGEWFTDFWQSLDGKDYNPKHWPDGITLRYGERIDSIQMMYGPYHGSEHGGEGGNITRLRLYSGDKITKVSGRRGVGPGAGIDQLTFHTLNGETLGPYGGNGGYPFIAAPPPHRRECYLAWISGRADLRLDNIAFHWRCKADVRKKTIGNREIFDSPNSGGRPSSLNTKLQLQILVLFTIILRLCIN